MFHFYENMAYLWSFIVFINPKIVHLYEYMVYLLIFVVIMSDNKAY